MSLSITIENLAIESFSPLDTSIPLETYTILDLFVTNRDLQKVDITNPEECQTYIDGVLHRNKAKVAFGGYLERRNLYASSKRFAQGEARDVHLGMDFWCVARTKVITPLDGKVHSFKNNSDNGNYGPTIILEHKVGEITFYTLYGHLSLESLNGLYVGKEFIKGESMATLGTPDINVNYAPHLHFQIIKDMGDFIGDYPGVCNESDIEFYENNCPDPNLLFKL